MDKKALAIAVLLVAIFIAGLSLWLPSNSGKDVLSANLENDTKNAKTVMWIGAHADDEVYVAGLLAKASLEYGKEAYVVSLTTGDEKQDQNNKESAELLGLKDYIKFYPEEICEGLGAGECQRLLIEEIKALFLDKKPGLIITFEPTNGFRGLQQHKMASQLAYRAYEESGIDADFYYAINRDEALAGLLNGPMDPLPYTDTLDLDEPLGKSSKTLWGVKLGLIRIYSDAVPAAEIIAENQEIQDKLLHKEFYRKVE